LKIASSDVAAGRGTGAPVSGLEPATSASAQPARGSARYRRWFLPLIGGVIVLSGQVLEDLADSPPLQMMPPTLLIQRWIVVALVIYLFGIWGVLQRTVEGSLSAVRPIVQIDDAAFHAYELRMRTLPIRSDLVLLLASAAVSVTLFAVLRADLLLDDPVTGASRKLPSGLVAEVTILAAYTVIGWAFLRLVYAIASLARYLGALTREPLRINVFDTTDLLPFGNIALVLGLAPVGVIAILTIGLGRPTTPVSWSILVEATLATVLALLLPLLGVHRQMSVAKDAAATMLNGRITELYQAVSGPLPTDVEETARLSNSTNSVLQMRKAVQEMKTWPFRDTLAFGRALLLATAPLIYTTLNELIRIFLIGPLAR
jgi:hypothetical protein